MMDLLEHMPTVHRNEAIKIWQSSANEELESTVSTGIIGTLFDGLLQFLKSILKTLQKCQPKSADRGKLENSLAALFFWGRDLGVSNGELDMKLQHSPRLRDTVLSLLISIGEFMSHGKFTGQRLLFGQCLAMQRFNICDSRWSGTRSTFA
jgi:hypothetical protein